MRAATLSYVEHRSDIARILRHARRASRAGHITQVMNDLRLLKWSGWMTPRHCRLLLRPFKVQR